MEGKTKAGLFFIMFSLFFFAGVLLFISHRQYQSLEQVIPQDSTLGPFAIGGQTVDQVFGEAETFYNLPITLTYHGQTIQVSPDTFGLRLDTESIRAELLQKIAAIYSEKNFIPYLFGNFQAEPVHLDIPVSFEREKIVAYYENEIAPRYDEPALSRQPNLNGAGFIAGKSGFTLDVDSAVSLTEQKLSAPLEERVIDLPVIEVPEPVQNEQSTLNLEIFLKNIIDQNQDTDQVTEVVLIDGVSGASFNLARRNQQDLQPEISFTAASTTKIPIMISSFKKIEGEPTAATRRQLQLMITESKNDATDWMMENIIGGTLAPLEVTTDLKVLGFQNTFLAGYFYLGAPLLDLFETPANTRTDINLKPDIYNQTTARDMAELLYAVYQCSETNTGLLLDTFGGAVSQAECNEMIDLLKNNHLPYLISAGVPESVSVAHKHGWIEESDGLLRTMSNVGVVYSPQGNYILSIFTYHPQNLIFDEGNLLFTRISAAIYSFYNPTERTVN